MSPDLERLIELQRLDGEIRRKLAALEKAPRELESARVRLDEAEAVIEAINQAIETDKTQRRDLEREVEDIRLKIDKDKAKLPALKTNVEYRALLKELDGYELAIRAIEDRQIELMEKGEVDARKIEPARIARDEEKKLFARTRQEKESAIATLKEKLASLRSDRAKIVDELPDSIYNNYERIAKARAGVGIARARDKICDGCHQMIPPQMYYNIQTTDAVFNCPHCARYLYHLPEPSADQIETQNLSSDRA